MGTYLRNGIFKSSISPSQYWTQSLSDTYSPRSFYDHISQKWVTVEMNGWDSTTSNLLISVSSNMEYDSNNSQFTIAYDDTGKTFGNYPQLGFNEKYIIVSTNSVSVSPELKIVGSKVFVIDRSKLVVNNILSYQVVIDKERYSICPFQTYNVNQNGIILMRLLPIGTTTARYASLSLIMGEIGSLKIYNDLLTMKSNYFWRSSTLYADQLNTFTQVQVGDDRIQSLILNGNSLYFCNTFFESSYSASQVMWWKATFNSSGTTITSFINETIPDREFFCFQPSMCVNKRGDAIVVYSQFSSQQYPSLVYTYRDNTDIYFRKPIKIATGGSQWNYSNWGSYTSSSLDPSDLQSFWLQGEITDDDSKWMINSSRIFPLSYVLIPRSNFLGKTQTDIGTWGSDIWNFRGGSEIPFPGNHPISGKVFSAKNDSLIVWDDSLQTFAIYPSLIQSFGQITINTTSSGYPLTGDIDGSGIDSMILFDAGQWKTFNRSGTGDIYSLGQAGDVPMTADFLNSRRKQIVVWRPSNATFYFKDIKTGIQREYQLGTPYPTSTDIPLSGDFFGKGYDQMAIFTRSNAIWTIYDFNGKTTTTTQFGIPNDIPLEGDFNGNGKASYAVYRPSDQTFDIKDIQTIKYGNNGDIPIPGLSVYWRMELLNLT
jgi:hypothetical protein